jgi:hypothetical protein
VFLSSEAQALRSQEGTAETHLQLAYKRAKTRQIREPASPDPSSLRLVLGTHKRLGRQPVLAHGELNV